MQSRCEIWLNKPIKFALWSACGIIFAGSDNELLATKLLPDSFWLVVVYKELEDDGFVITGFLTSRIAYLIKKDVVWKKV